jgi:hypothetical protein
VLEERVKAGPCWHLPRHEQWVWDGRPLVGQRVLVRCYHGLGDTIQFARFLPLVAEQARQLAVWAPEALLPLLATMHLGAQLLPLHDGTPDVDYDVDLEIMEVAHALRITLDTLPSQVSYFQVRSAERPAGGFCAGVVAQAGDWDAQRSIDGAELVKAVRSAGAVPISLQLEQPIDGVADRSTADVVRLAERLRSLDLVISVDTMVAHLAGALGVPTWTLLKRDADWRWMADRGDSPWYPTMRLFRQRSLGDWTPVLAEVTVALAACAR